MSNKRKFTEESIRLADTIGALANDLSDLNDVFFDRGYNGGGADEIVDIDVESFGIVASDLGGLITIAQQFSNFLNNIAVVAGDYDSTISKLRDDL